MSRAVALTPDRARDAQAAAQDLARRTGARVGDPMAFLRGGERQFVRKAAYAEGEPRSFVAVIEAIAREAR